MLVASLIWIAVRLLLARDHLESARTQLGVARSALVDRDLTRAEKAIGRAGRDTATARSLTGDPVTWAWAHVPLAGRNVAVVRGLATGADDVVRDVLPPALTTAREADPESLRRPDGSIDLAALQRISALVQPAAQKAAQVRRHVHALPESLLIPPVARGRETFVAQLDQLTNTIQDAADAIRVSPEFLGAGGKKHWFVMVQQNGESRGTGGIIGGYAVLEAAHGKITVLRQGSNADLRDGSISTAGFAADFRARYELDGGFAVWPNVNLSPDLPTVAKVITAKWRAEGGGPIDGVLTIDAESLAGLLQGGPPIRLDDGKAIASDSLVDYLNVGQYVGVPADPTGLASRKDRLSGIAQQVLARLTQGGGGSSRSLLTGVVKTLQSGHLHFASNNAVLAPVLARTGLDGALPRGPAPVAYAVVNNISGGKLDSFLDRSISYAGGSCSGKRRNTTIAVTLRSRVPGATTLPDYVTVREDETGSHQSATGRVLLEVYGTRGAVLRSATLNGLAVSTVQGRTVTPLQRA
ncbi:MAG: hypothetical protein QOE58_2132, partial [Actinomycetota bacterium]|nr:hypothetical protein [Actinomycetota bacterium]